MSSMFLLRLVLPTITLSIPDATSTGDTVIRIIIIIKAISVISFLADDLSAEIYENLIYICCWTSQLMHWTLSPISAIQSAGLLNHSSRSNTYRVDELKSHNMGHSPTLAILRMLSVWRPCVPLRGLICCLR